MDTKWQPEMRSAISEVLETMFFESVDFESQNLVPPVWYGDTKIRFSDAHQDREITIRVTEPFARMIAANFLGSDEGEVSAEEVADVMRELANMIGGNYLARLADAKWKLGIPSFSLSHGRGDDGSTGLPLSYMGDCIGVIFLQSVP